MPLTVGKKKGVGSRTRGSGRGSSSAGLLRVIPLKAPRVRLAEDQDAADVFEMPEDELEAATPPNKGD